MTCLFCGIDVAKFEHVASIYDPSTGEFLLDSLHFTNNDEGFKSLLAHLNTYKNVLNLPLTIIRPYFIF